MQFQLPAHLHILTANEQVRLQGCHVPPDIKVEVCSFEKLAGLLRDLSTRQRQPWRLQLSMEGATMDASDCGQAGAALAACTSLTCLQLIDTTNPLLMPWAKHAATLRQLRRLDVSSWEKTDEDLLLLTVLTGLTRLGLCCDTSNIAVLLACSLTGLQVLKLWCDQLQTASVVPALARLTGLRHLHLASGNCSSTIHNLFTPT